MPAPTFINPLLETDLNKYANRTDELLYELLYNIQNGGLGGGATPPAGADTQIQFNNAGAFGASSNLVWDNVNNRLGIGVTPISKLHVKGAGTTSATTSLLVQNSAGSTMFGILDNSRVFFGNAGVNQPYITNFDGSSTEGGNGLAMRIRQQANINGILMQYFADGLFNNTTSGINVSHDFIASGYRGATGSGNYNALRLGYTINNISGSTQTGTARGILVNATETSLQGMSHKLMDLQVGGSSKFEVLSTGSTAVSINSTTKGFLPPRMTTTQRDAIAAPARGLQVFNTTLGTNDIYDGTSWQRFGSQTLIKGSGSTSATTNFLLQNSSSTELFSILDNGSFTHTDTGGANFSLTRPTALLQPRFLFSSGTGHGLFIQPNGSNHYFGFDGILKFSRETINQDIVNDNTPALAINSTLGSIAVGKNAAAAATESLIDFYSYRNNVSVANALHVTNASYNTIFAIKERGAVQIGVDTAPVAALEVQDDFGLGLIADFRLISGVSVATIDGTNRVVNIWNANSDNINLDVSGVTRSSFFNLHRNATPGTLTKGDIYMSGDHLFFYNGTTSIQLD